MNEQVSYQGKDLEAMSFASNYHRWILDEIREYLGRSLVEVGSGTGSFSQLLLEERPDALALVEPSEMFETLRDRISSSESNTRITFHNTVFRSSAGNIRENASPDTVLYINVLEHIRDDGGELATVFETLRPGGRCVIFVPAFQWLYGEFDKRVGHFRRYTKKGLESICTAAGFEIERSRYFDLVGVFPWYVKYKLLRHSGLEPGSVAAYDKIAVPVVRRLERLLRPPFGKNILLVVRKPDPAR